MNNVKLPSMRKASREVNFVYDNYLLAPVLLIIAENMLKDIPVYYFKAHTLVYGLRARLFARMLNQRNWITRAIITVVWFMITLHYMTVSRSWSFPEAFFLPIVSTVGMCYLFFIRFRLFSTDLSNGSNPLHPRQSLSQSNIALENKLFKRFFFAPQFIRFFDSDKLMKVKTFTELNQMAQEKFSELLESWKRSRGGGSVLIHEEKLRRFYYLGGILGIFKIRPGFTPQQEFDAFYPLLASENNHTVSIKEGLLASV